MLFSVTKRLVLLSLLIFGSLLSVGCSTSKDKNGDTTLASLVVSAGTLLPTTLNGTDAFRMTVDGTVSSTTVTAKVNNGASTLTINGSAIASGTTSPAIALSVGSNLIPVVITAENGSTRTITIIITKVLSSDATLASLGLSKGTLAPAFNASVKTYAFGIYSGQTSLTVTPTLTHPRASVKVNGTAVASGSASGAIALAVGDTVVTILVTAEDGTQATTTLTIKELTPNVPVTVLDSTNGTAVPTATLTLLDTAGTVLESGIAVDATGSATLSLDTAVKYTVLAKGTGTAQACYANLDLSKESRVDLYCHSLGMTSFPAEAPQIKSLSWSSDGTTWTPVDANAISGTLENINYLKVTAIARSGISETAWSGFGIAVNFDKKATALSYYSPLEIVENSTPVTINGLAYYQTTAILPLYYFTNTVAGTTHSVDVVAYDVANNRVEQKVYVTVTDATTNAADPDISALTPSSFFNVLYTYGLSRDYFALTPVDSNNVSYLPYIQFAVLSGTTIPGIRGFELYRSADGTNYTKVLTQQYGYLYKATSGIYTCYDPDTTLTEGITYYYKVKAFTANTTTNGGYSLTSAAVPSKFLPVTVSLVAPAMSAISTSVQPRFDFAISNPALWDSTVSDYFYFYLYIKDKVGNGIFGQSYRYNFASGIFQMVSGSSWVTATSYCSISADHTTISINYPNATTLLPGTTYEWSIFGTKGSASYTTSDASYFIRYTPGTSTYGRAISYGSTYEKSYGAINGFFTLTIDPSAK